MHSFNFQLFIQIPDDLRVYFSLLILGPQFRDVLYFLNPGIQLLIKKNGIVLSIVFIIVMRLIFLKRSVTFSV